MMIKQYSIH